MKFKAFIEFTRAIKSRNELNEFEKFCKTEKTLKQHFLGVKGRKFIFGFKEEIDRNLFFIEAENMMTKNGFITERVLEVI